MPWHYVNQEREQTPVPDDDVQALVTSGDITADTLIWQDGMGDWIPASQARPDLFPSSSLQPVAHSSQPSTAFDSTQPSFAAPAPTSGLAIASLVCGILSVLGSWCYGGGFVVGVPAVVCGHMALSRIKMSNDQLGGRGLAIAGLVTGYIGILVSLAFVIFMVVVFAGAAAAATSLPVPP